MARPMSDDEIVAFMRQGSRTGKLATIRPDGSPHVAPIWFDFDDRTGEIVFLTADDTVKGRNLRRDGRVSIVVDLMKMPFSFARIDGVATATPFDDDPAGARHWATETSRRYVGDDRAEEFGRRNAVPGESVIRVAPTRMIGVRGVAD